MSDDTKAKTGAALNVLGQIASIATVPLALWIWYTVGLKVQNSVQELQIKSEAEFVQVETFNRAVDGLNASVTTLQQTKADKDSRTMPLHEQR